MATFITVEDSHMTTVVYLVLRNVAQVGAGIVTQYAGEREARSRKGEGCGQL